MRLAEYLFDSIVMAFTAYGTPIAEVLSLLGRPRTVAGVLGTASLTIFASPLSAMLRTVLNRAFRVSSRSLARGIAFDLMAMALTAGVVVVVSFGVLAVTTLGDVLRREEVEGVSPRFPSGGGHGAMRARLESPRDRYATPGLQIGTKGSALRNPR